MLVIISDLHLTDGTSGASIHPGAFSIFAERLADLALRASWRSDGRYRPLESIDLVLLGDVLDVIRSTRWLESEARPWGDAAAALLLQTVGGITEGILAQNQAGLEVLRSLSASGAIRLPPANRAGEPVYSAAGQPVPVRIHYMVGNHDWMLHLPGSGYDALRHCVAAQMGLANRSDQPFPHDPLESDQLLDVLRRHRVFARHGDVFDPMNFEGDRNQSSLGDVIVIELVNRFAVEAAYHLGDDLPEEVLTGLRELDNIRPLVMVPVWIDGLLDRACPYPAIRKHVKAIWDRLADEVLALQFVRQRDTWHPRDLVDGLEMALKFSKRVSIGWASRIAAWLQKTGGRPDQSYSHHALAEQDFRNRRARHIVYGHTHQPESVPLDASYADGYVLNQVYFNSGTWRRVHRPTQLAPSEHEFIPAESMTYLAFFQQDEREGRPFESWTGMLGIGGAESPRYRLDRSPPAAASVLAAAPAFAAGAPHFSTVPREAGIIPVRRA